MFFFEHFFKFINPGLNNSNYNLIKYLEESSFIEKYKIFSNNNFFIVNLIRNSKRTSLNPTFPIISVFLNLDFDGWIQIIQTDSNKYFLKKFVDYSKDPYDFPFYTRSKNFYDAPYWLSTYKKKPITFWKAHLYAVKKDSKGKINFLGGIFWGFKMKKNSFYPESFEPKALTFKDWKKDLDFILASKEKH